MKSLRVEYGAESGQRIVLFDGDVDEVTWVDGPAGISVSGKTRRGGGSSGGQPPKLFEMFANAKKQQTAAMVERKKEEMNSSEPVEVSSD